MSGRDFYRELGIALTGSGELGNVSIRCFADPEAHEHNDRNASCSVNLTTGSWKCFGCGAEGGAFDAAVALGLSRADAASLAKKHDLFPTDREQPRSNGPDPRNDGHGTTSEPPLDAEPRTLAEVVDVFQRWLFLPDVGVVLAVLGAIAANRLEGDDPVWLLLVGAPGSGKTEALMSVSRLPNVHQAATLTEPSLLSGSPKRDRGASSTGGVLRQLGDFGILLHKDFGSVLSMHRDGRAQVLAALREIFDGSWTRLLGTDGGKTLHWQGKAGMVAGCTPTIDRHAAVMAAMGDRFILYRLPPVARATQSRQALIRKGHQQQMRRELIEAVCGLFAGIGPDPQPRETSDAEVDLLVVLSDFCTRARSAVERDGYTREIELIPDPEMPARLAIGLRTLADGLDIIGVQRRETWRIVTKAALDNVPALRLAAIKELHATGDKVATTKIATALDLPTTTTRRTLEDLAMLHVAERWSHGQGKTDEWSLTPEARCQFDAIAAGQTVPEMSEDSYEPSSLNHSHRIEEDFSGTVPDNDKPPAAAGDPHETDGRSDLDVDSEFERIAAKFGDLDG